MTVKTYSESSSLVLEVKICDVQTLDETRFPLADVGVKEACLGRTHESLLRSN